MHTAEFRDAIGAGLTEMLKSKAYPILSLAASALGDVAENGELYPSMNATSLMYAESQTS
jgi:hypothetical protein